MLYQWIPITKNEKYSSLLESNRKIIDLLIDYFLIMNGKLVTKTASEEYLKELDRKINQRKSKYI
jgi:hypothetical protein